MTQKTSSRCHRPFLIVDDGEDRETGAKRVRSQRAPIKDLAPLLRAARRDHEVGRVVLALLNAVLGGADHAILGERFHVSFLPKRLRPHAEGLLRWSIRPNRILNEVLVARARLGLERLRQLAGSPRGRRARALVEQASVLLPAVNRRTPGATLVPFEVLSEFNGMLVTEKFLHRAQSVGSEVIFRNDCGPIANNRVISEGAVVVSLQHGCVIRSACIYAKKSSPRTDRRKFGELHAFTDMGMEGGYAWLLAADDGEPIFLERGDHLTVYADERESQVLWQGKIEPDDTVNLARRGPRWFHPRALGHWVCWIQRGEHPDEWARLFFRRPRLRARLTRSVQKVNRKELFS